MSRSGPTRPPPPHTSGETSWEPVIIAAEPQPSPQTADKRIWRNMATPLTSFGETVWELPPLILHPFNERVSPSTLLENSKAALMLSGLIPPDGSDEDELKRRVLVGRYGELRMLYFVGKDVFRWIDQCVDWSAGYPPLQNQNVHPQSFAELLTAHPSE